MGRLRKEALRIPEFEEPMDSAEIDRGFDRAIGSLVKKATEERKKNELQRSPPEPPGKLYYLEGHFSEDGMPIPLKEEFRAETLEKAKKITRKQVRYYHNLEGYAVDMSLFDTPNYPKKVLYWFRIPAKKE